MKLSEMHLGFIGFGHMAQILFKAIDQAKLIPRSQVFFHQRSFEKTRKNEMEFGITSTSLETIQKRSDLLILAVRPNQVEGVLKELHIKKMLVSVAAGIRLSVYQKFPLSLRVMPNIAAEVNEAMSVFSYGKEATAEFRSVTRLLFSSMGEVVEVEESLMNIACAIAGSGPGFVIKLIQEMAHIGEKHGLNSETAIKMAAQVFLGSAKLVIKQNPTLLLEQIATPNGTTEAGLEMMRTLEVGKHFQKVIEASCKRSKELEKNLFSV